MAATSVPRKPQQQRAKRAKSDPKGCNLQLPDDAYGMAVLAILERIAGVVKLDAPKRKKYR